MPLNPLTETALNLPKRSGKVRDVYDLGDTLLIVSTDRISAFDWILPSGIPNKGRVLTKLSSFWFERLGIENHLLSLELPKIPEIPTNLHPQLAGRTMLVRKAEVVPFECVVRGFIEGSAWQEYQRSGTICGVRLPTGLRQCDQLAEPIFTPTTKAESGHDQAIDFDSMATAIGLEAASLLRDRSLDVYRQASSYAATKGIIIADTKFEWGWHHGKLLLIDEVLTPDSSRFWPADQYAPGQSQPSYDKQFVREWLMQCGWDRNSPAPALPQSIIEQTAAKYVEAYERISGQRFEMET